MVTTLTEEQYRYLIADGSMIMNPVKNPGHNLNQSRYFVIVPGIGGLWRIGGMFNGPQQCLKSAQLSGGVCVGP